MEEKEQSGSQEKRRLVERYDLLYEGVNLKEVIDNKGLKLIIPRIFLQGRQNLDEYSNKKRREIEEELKNYGKGYLRENPVIVCAIPLGENMILAIIDGHHRTRYSGKYKIHDIPCLVCDPETIVDAINSNKPEDKKIGVDSFIQKAILETAEAMASLNRVLPETELPQMVQGISDLEGLKKRFKPFN